MEDANILFPKNVHLCLRATSGSVKNTFKMRKKKFAGLENMEQCLIKTYLSSHTPLNYIILFLSAQLLLENIFIRLTSFEYESKLVPKKDRKSNSQKGDLGTFQKHDSSYIGSGPDVIEKEDRGKKGLWQDPTYFDIRYLCSLQLDVVSPHQSYFKNG